MKVNIEELITLNYELEGLLYLALHRGDNTPEQIWEMISDKIDNLKEGVSSYYASDEQEQKPDNEIIEIEQPNESIAEPIAEITETLQQPSQNNEIVAEPEPELPIAPEPTEEPAQPIQEPTIELETVQEPEPVKEPEPIKPVEQPKPANPLPPTPIVNSVADEPVRLEDKLARANSRDLRKAFSLNDRFRFRRELFSNSDSEFTDTLNLVEAMNSISEAEDYFYIDLGWDVENPEVADFMTIIKQHFSNK